MAQKVILLAEDNLQTASRVKCQLEEAGFKCHVVTSVSSARDMADLYGGFDVLLSGLGLPEHIDEPKKVFPYAGLRLGKEISQIIPGIKVVFHTRKEPVRVQEMLLAKMNFVGLLGKPFRIRDFRRAING